MGPVPAVMLTFALIVAFFYPISKNKLEAIHQQLKDRKEAKSQDEERALKSDAPPDIVENKE